MEGRKTKYAVIQDDIINKIQSGEYSAGSELPSESDLIEQYGVSRVTVRRAVDELYHKGYIEKMQGKRTCVRGNARFQELTSISSYTEEILKHGMTPGRSIINTELRVSTADEAEKLELQKADPVFHMERIYYADDKPLCFTATTLPYHIFRDIETYDFQKLSLYKVIEEMYNLKIKTTSLKLKAVPAPDEIRKYLNISRDTPLLYTSGITFGQRKEKEIPIELFTTYYLTTNFEYTLTQKRQ